MTDSHANAEDGSRLLKAVQAIAISPKDARALVDGYREQLRAQKLDVYAERQALADRIIGRYAKLAATSGATTGLVGVVPGIGTAAAILAGGSADIAISVKLQVDMCMCLADAYGHDLNSEDARHLAFIVAAGGALEQAGTRAGVEFGSRAGVRLVRQYLKGTALEFLKQLFKKLGIVFTRKALEKAIPFGIGAVIGGGANYAMTKYVGSKAREFFTIDAQMRDEGDTE
jgi:uncharacterized protein (DUF697 family)